MFGAKYNRLTFWIWSVILFIPFSLFSTLSRATEASSETANLSLGFRGLVLIVVIIWISTLANRIRDYGSNPWISIFSIVPLVNVGLALYYGIAKHKQDPTQGDNDNTKPSLTKAVYNHSKDITSEVKPAINDYKQRHQSSANDTVSVALDEDEVYEKVMLEIEEDKKVRATWGKALARSGGDENRAKALYIQMRVEAIEQERLNKINMQRKEKEKQQRQILEDREYKALLREEEERVFREKKRERDQDPKLKVKRISLEHRTTLDNLSFDELKSYLIKFYKKYDYSVILNDSTNLRLRHTEIKNAFVSLEDKSRIRKLSINNVVYFPESEPCTYTLTKKY